MTQQATETSLHSILQSFPLNEGTEETDWKRRFATRQEGVDNVKKTAGYQKYNHLGADKPGGSRSLTPDVHDRSMSKRQWENVMAEWRALWRNITECLEHLDR